MEMLTEQKLLCGMSLFKTIVTELRTMRKYFICKEITSSKDVVGISAICQRANI